jgi:hypothetical protein
MPLLRPRAVGAETGTGRVLIAATADGPLTQVLKWIPIEVIGFYQALTAAIPTDESKARLWLTGAGVVVCGLWIAFATRPATSGYAWRQTILAMLAFAFWGAAVQTEVLKVFLPWWKIWMGSIVLIFGSVLLPIFDGILARLGVPQNQ